MGSAYAPKTVLRSGRIVSMFSPNGPWGTVSSACRFQQGPIARYNELRAVDLGTTSNSEPLPELATEVFGKYETQGFKWNVSNDKRRLQSPEVLGMLRQLKLI